MKLQMKALVLAGLIALTSCDKKKETKTEVVENIEVSDNAPKPLKVYEKDGAKVKAYDFDKLEYFLNKKNDTTYVVNFWATWCEPCKEEMPSLQNLQNNSKFKNLKIRNYKNGYSNIIQCVKH